MVWRTGIAVGVVLAVVAVVVATSDGGRNSEQWKGQEPTCWKSLSLEQSVDLSRRSSCTVSRTATEAERPVSIAQVEADAVQAHAERVEQELTLYAKDAEDAPMASRPSWKEQYRMAIEAVFPEQEWDNALAIVRCETGETYAPHAVGDSGRAEGGFQVHAKFWGPVPVDILGQARQAFGIWQLSGWSPWTCRSVLR